MDLLVGAGGWAYFDVGGSDALATYAKAFPFVEVNATFYRHPDLRAVAFWRRRVPPSFRFAVRAHRDLTHRSRLRPTSPARASLARTARIAEGLDAVAIVLETPETVRPDPRDLQDLLSSADLPCPVALELRAYRGRPIPQDLAATMEANDVADALDFSRQAPRTASTIAYGRLFGSGDGGRWEFTDDEMKTIRKQGETGDRARVVFTFHGVRMYKDAGRFLTYVRTGTFPRATRHTGLRSLEEVLGDATFPSSKSELTREHGFRVIDVAEDRRIHAERMLAHLPPGRYTSLSEVLSKLATVNGLRGETIAR